MAIPAPPQFPFSFSPADPVTAGCLSFQPSFNPFTNQWIFTVSLNIPALQLALAAPGPPAGRYVRIALPAVGYLSLAEVQVFDRTGKNLALHQPATQSTTLVYLGDDGPTANLAVDGSTDGNFFDRSVTHTDGTDAGWWQVDLGSSKIITKIIIWGRTDSNQDRIIGAVVSISNNADGSSPAWKTILNVIPNPSTAIVVF